MARPGKNDKAFLDAWRDLEAALQEEGPCRVMDLEDNLTRQNKALEASKLRTCRQIRNFLVHDGPGFVEATGTMVSFLADMTYEIRRVNGTVKDLMATAARYGAVTESDLICEACNALLSKKKGDILVLDGEKKLLGVLGARAMAFALSDGAGADKVAYLVERNALDKAETIPADLPAKQAPDHKCAVVDAKGRCIGVLHPERGWS